MAKRKQIYKCEACGNIIGILHGGDGDLVCCGENMKFFEEKTADQGREKHVPVIEIVDGSTKVKVRSMPHPMEEKHFIEWIEIFDNDKSYRHYLKPGDAELCMEGKQCLSLAIEINQLKDSIDRIPKG